MPELHPAPVPPAIGLAPTSLVFTAQQGSSNPPAQTLAITNKGGGTLTWSVSESTPWIAPAPTAGSGNGMATISVLTGALKAGTILADNDSSLQIEAATGKRISFTLTARCRNSGTPETNPSYYGATVTASGWFLLAQEAAANATNG